MRGKSYLLEWKQHLCSARAKAQRESLGELERAKKRIPGVVGSLHTFTNHARVSGFSRINIVRSCAPFLAHTNLMVYPVIVMPKRTVKLLLKF